MKAARFTGAGIGLLALLLVLVSARPDSRAPDLGARLDLGITAPGTLGIEPGAPAPVLSAPSLLDGAPPAEGRAVISNLGNRPVTFRLAVTEKQLAGFGRLADVLRLRIVSDRGLLAYVGLPDLRSGSAPVRLGVRDSAAVSIEAWIPAGTPDTYQGERADADLAVRIENPERGGP
ncbi:MAG TPA: hypothetical protein VMF31_01765 [Solirubrobacterales bacterium]|nr:hypothetical protein [Solirubrobacterales bacterium]